MTIEHEGHDQESVFVCRCTKTKYEDACAKAGCNACKRQRPSWDLFFMRLAYTYAQRASCTRRQVGAVIVRERDRRIVGAGYNGAPSGQPDCYEVGCFLRDIGGKPSCVRTIHAESNALDNAGILEPTPHTLYCTTIPCYPCAQRIIQTLGGNGQRGLLGIPSGIGRVVYHEFYDSQGTRDVEDLFRTHWYRDAFTRELTPTTTPPLVELVKLDVPMSDVRPNYGG